MCAYLCECVSITSAETTPDRCPPKKNLAWRTTSLGSGTFSSRSGGPRMVGVDGSGQVPDFTQVSSSRCTVASPDMVP